MITTLMNYLAKFLIYIPNLKFTIKKEKDNCQPFLNVHLFVTYTELLTTIYKKPIFASKYIPF